jgi:Cu2+-exporting ATPase
MAIDSKCFHCAEPLNGSTLCARVDNAPQAVCCAGCLAAAEWIDGVGLQDFYRYRSGPIGRPVASQPNDSQSEQDAWAAFAQTDVADRFVRHNDQTDTIDLVVDGLRCSACSWLIDRSLHSIEGVCDVQVNAATGRAHIAWTPNAQTLPTMLRLIASLGFTPHPTDAAIGANMQRTERNKSLKRLAVAAFGMMQVMMFAIASYSADINHEVIDAELANFFRLTSLVITAPVLFYAGAPFITNALRSLRLRTISVDVSVSAALLLAFAASVWNSLGGHGEVYFDSITMFVFFLTLGRFAEMSVRHRSTGVADALAHHLPAIAHRLQGESQIDVATSTLQTGDLVLVRTGEIAPCDGLITEGITRMDESLLTGESIAIERSVGDRVLGGGLNIGAPIRLRVLASGNDTVIANVASLMQRAQAQKPSASRLTDAAAARFVRHVFVGAVVVCVLWLLVDPSRAFSATLAVLVVACPCAFSIAMPATFSAATAKLARLGILVVRIDAIEALAKIKHCVLDKTGTLTQGRMRIEHTVFNDNTTNQDVLAVAAALERYSEHPIARAFTEHYTDRVVTDVNVHAGRGVEGIIDGIRYRIGSLSFVHELCGKHLTLDMEATIANTSIALVSEHEMLATFSLGDSLREGAGGLAAQLDSLQISSEILSGDSTHAVAAVASECKIDSFTARRLPAEKLAHIQERIDRGLTVMVVGDGINDAPVLGAADVSIAMGHGAALAHASADMILVNEHLTVLPEAIAIARRAVSVTRQNLFWAAAYNLTALPLAAMGLIPPWIAAVGMSLSSIGVILNAMRVAPRRSRITMPPQTFIEDATQTPNLLSPSKALT